MPTLCALPVRVRETGKKREREREREAAKTSFFQIQRK